MDTDQDFGRSFAGSLARFDPATCSWKTSQLCLLGGLIEFSGTWPRAGTTRNGTAYRRQPLVPRTFGTDSFLWPTPVHKPGGGSVLDGGSNSRKAARRRGMMPTPRASDGSKGGPNQRGSKGDLMLPSYVARFPTPTANRWDGLQSHGVNVVSGQLNPTWVEWLMGFPLGWTDLEDSAMPLCPRSQSGSDAA